MRDLLPTLQIRLGPNQERKHLQLDLILNITRCIFPTYCLSARVDQWVIVEYVLLRTLNPTQQAAQSVVNYWVVGETNVHSSSANVCHIWHFQFWVRQLLSEPWSFPKEQKTKQKNSCKFIKPLTDLSPWSILTTCAIGTTGLGLKIHPNA